MKRKILTLALSLAMVLSLAVSVSAAAVPSVTGESVKADESNPAGVTVATDASQLPAEEAAVLEAAVEQITSAATTSEFLANAGITAAVEEVLATIEVPVSVDDLVPAATFNVSIAAEAQRVLEQTGSVELTFAVDGVADGDIVVVLVFNGTDWEVVPAVVKDGKVVGTFTSVGTVVIMKADSEARVTSPQTSGTNLEGVMICGTVLSLAVLALCIKRSRVA